MYKCSSQFICNIEKGRSSIPSDLLDILINNNCGWNVSPLLEDNTAAKDSFADSLGLCPNPEDLTEEMERLQDLIVEKNRRIAELEAKERTLTSWINQILKIKEQDDRD